jgi:hypothetical protein
VIAGLRSRDGGQGLRRLRHPGEAQAFYVATSGPAADPHRLNAKVAERAVVLVVVDGDTLRVRVGGAREKARLLGINSPERGRKGRGSATKALSNLTRVGRAVTLTSDRTQPYEDQYGRQPCSAVEGVGQVLRRQDVRTAREEEDLQECREVGEEGASQDLALSGIASSIKAWTT